MLAVVLRAYGKLKELMNSRLTEEAADQQNGLYPDFYHIHSFMPFYVSPLHGGGGESDTLM
ncbi:unnamed protein product [Prunus armeniaca]